MKRSLFVLSIFLLSLFCSSSVFALNAIEKPQVRMEAGVSSNEENEHQDVPTEVTKATKPVKETIVNKLPQPLNTILNIRDQQHILIKEYELTPETDPSILKENPFEFDGYEYSFYDLKKEDIFNEEKREETQEITLQTQSDDVGAILEQLNTEMDYNKDGFTGKLLLDNETIATKVEGYVTKTYTVNQSQTITNLSSNDPYNIPKTMTQNSVLLNLTGIQWIVNQSDAVDYEAIPTSYTAVANYSGSYSKQMVTGYVTKAIYKGEVMKRTLAKTKYTLNYIGEKLPAPIPEVVAISTTTNEAKNIFEWNPIVWSIGGILALICFSAGVLAYFLLYCNTIIHLKEGEDYRQIARRHIQIKNPVVSLTGLDVSGREVAIYVKKITAQKLFGHHIKTVFGDDFSVLCLVDKQFSDFWYMVNVPEALEKEEVALSEFKKSIEEDEKAEA